MARMSLMKTMTLFGLAASLAWSAAAIAQDKSTYYTITHPTEFKINWKAFYDKADAMTVEARGMLPHRLNLAYGSAPKQQLDLYLPSAKPTAAPIFVFIHGGGFREGDRAHYGFVARPLGKHGIITVVPSYRLTPAATYPDQPDDIEHALRWVFHNIRSYGGNPARVYVGGHSAGAILTATVSLKTGWLSRLSLPADLIKGCVPISGPYDLREEKALFNYLPNAALRTEASPLFNVASPPAASLVAVGSVEPYVNASRALVEAIRGKGGKAELIVLEGQNHDDTALTLGDERSALVQAIVKMIGPSPAGASHQ